jgi:hypothetical protein
MGAGRLHFVVRHAGGGRTVRVDRVFDKDTAIPWASLCGSVNSAMIAGREKGGAWSPRPANLPGGQQTFGLIVRTITASVGGRA